MGLSKLYAVADTGFLTRQLMPLREYAEGLSAAGVRLVQLRDKMGLPQEVLHGSAVIAEAFAGFDCLLIMNDRADLALLAGFDGVHVGQEDLTPEDVKTVLAACGNSHLRSEMSGIQPTLATIRPSRRWAPPPGFQNGGIVGLSTHTDAQVVGAQAGAADYVAIGPVFATGTKLDAEAVIGLEGVRRARALTSKPLVAIGGITRQNARLVIDAGADSVAVISGFLVAGEPVEKVARDFMELLG